jgi:prepilin-type N-terminal cleavage/methylation domain-containing protein
MMIRKYKNAFSMVEVVFVILILGIVSAIGAEIIADVYRSYILERATHRSSIKTELAANQIANRITYSIPRTVIGRKTSGYKGINNLDANDYEVLEWIAYDNDSFSATRVPGWSGFIDLDTSTADTLDTKGSHLEDTDNVISNLSNGNSNIGGRCHLNIKFMSIFHCVSKDLVINFLKIFIFRRHL